MARRVKIYVSNDMNKTAVLRVVDIETGVIERTQKFSATNPGSISLSSISLMKEEAEQWANAEYQGNYDITFENFDEASINAADGANVALFRDEAGAIINAEQSVVSSPTTEDSVPERSININSDEIAPDDQNTIVAGPSVVSPPPPFQDDIQRAQAGQDGAFLDNKTRDFEAANLATGAPLGSSQSAGLIGSGPTVNSFDANPEFLGPEDPLGELEEDIEEERFEAKIEKDVSSNKIQTKINKIASNLNPDTPIGLRGDAEDAAATAQAGIGAALDIAKRGLNPLKDDDKEASLNLRQPNVKGSVQLIGLSKQEQEILSNMDTVALSRNRGIAGDIMIEAVPGFVELNTEKVINNKNNAWIVLGRDRIDSRASGYGGSGHTQCAAIDLVAGRMSPVPRSVDFKGKPIYVDPMPVQIESEYGSVMDAARIYISQKTDVDDNFQLAKGRIGNKVARSAIALKADGIRVIGREGIKLITRGDAKNSQGGRITKTAGIDIIAGNDDKRLQPMLLGNNVTSAFSDLCKIIEQITGTVQGCVNNIAQLDAALAAHFHISPFFGAPTLPSPVALPACIGSLIELVSVESFSIVAEKWNMNSFRLRYLKSGAPRCIRSRYNNNN